MAPKPLRPTDPYVEMTDDWKATVRRVLKEIGWTQTRLAREVDVTPGAISIMLNEGTRSSRLVAKVCSVLQVPRPGIVDLREQEILTALRKIRASDSRLFDRLAEQIRREVARLESRSKKS